MAVYPQEIIYRAFLFHRYRNLFEDRGYLVHASAVVFSFGHIIYYHPYSMLFTFVGGYLFATTYRRSRSLLAASFEHSLYGCYLYTIGLGRFFYTGIEQLLD
jgi:membrane protease YdiL (CAAX protease family)